MVIVLIDVQVEGGVTVYIVWPETRPQSLLNRLISQPLLQLRGSTNIVDDALFEGTNISSKLFLQTFKNDSEKEPVQQLTLT